MLPGCAGKAPRPPAALAPPPPPVVRSPQEAALERSLGEFYGAPYQAGGNSPQGVDCSGLVQAAFQRAGVAVSRTVAQQFEQGQPVALGDLRFGDVVFFNRNCHREVFTAGLLTPAWAGAVCHNGIYLGEGRFVHASPQGVFVSRLDADIWRVSYTGARRYLPAGP
jgi:cell wall-associated NlpC family hydrolase